MWTVNDQIKEEADLYFRGDFMKAMEAHFQKKPQDWELHKAEQRELQKRQSGIEDVPAEDPDRVNRTLEYRTLEEYGLDKNLDRNKPADVATAQERALSKDPVLAKRYRAAFTVQAGARLKT